MEGTTWRGAVIIKAAATWLWLLALISGSQLVVAVGPKVTEPSSILELDLGATWVGEYSSFIRGLRKGLASKYEKHGIPVLRDPKEVPDDQRFLLAKLISYNKIGVATLAIDVTTGNVAGYEASSKYYRFKDTSHLPPPIPFKEDTTEKVELPFKNTYTELEEAAKAKREDIELSRTILSGAIESLQDASSNSDRAEKARALIVVLQLVCEAARFTHIQRKMHISLSRLQAPFKPDAAMIGLENNWVRLSTEIQQSYQKAFYYPLGIKRAPDGTIFHVDSVSDILKTNLALLKFTCISGRDRLSSSSSSSTSISKTAYPPPPPLLLLYLITIPSGSAKL
ncbi:hypothetical protein Tsubulata_028470 [Turnera subulata]|uniref:rRNA N-glycosylase n=1 Tax=Turnera subulata TaxID=218843 RepID=A0A9Q0FN38_9ROSI|nr:hypothetical protein Tsubulata_028470 [Turnera subulata]